MNVVLFGEDIFTASVLFPLLSDGHKISAIICPIYKTDFAFRTLSQTAKKYEIPFHHKKQIDDEEVERLIRRLQPEIILSVHLKKILPPRIFSLAKYAINVHPSLLPQYRGLSPQHQPLIHSDVESGVTIHFIEQAVDEGDIVLQEKFVLTSEMYIYDLQLELLKMYQRMVPAAFTLLSTQGFQPIPQDNSFASWFGPIRKADRQIDLKKGKFATYNLIRAVSKPYKGAFINDLPIWRSYFPDENTERVILNKYPDVDVYLLDEKLVIRLHDGVLLSDDFDVTNE